MAKKKKTIKKVAKKVVKKKVVKTKTPKVTDVMEERVVILEECAIAVDERLSRLIKALQTAKTLKGI